MITPLDRPQDRPESALTVPERETAVEVAGAPDRRRRVALPIAGTARPDTDRQPDSSSARATLADAGQERVRVPFVSRTALEMEWDRGVDAMACRRLRRPRPNERPPVEHGTVSGPGRLVVVTIPDQVLFGGRSELPISIGLMT